MRSGPFGRNFALRHSITNLRLGAAPMVSVRTLAEESISRSSQNGATTAFGAARVGIVGFAYVLAPSAEPNVRKPFVLTVAEEYDWPWNGIGNGKVIPVVASSPVSAATTLFAAVKVPVTWAHA